MLHPGVSLHAHVYAKMAQAVVKNNPGGINPRNQTEAEKDRMVQGTSEPKETPAAKTALAASKTGKAPVKTSKPPPKATDMTTAQLNKEVFLVLKEL